MFEKTNKKKEQEEKWAYKVDFQSCTQNNL